MFLPIFLKTSFFTGACATVYSLVPALPLKHLLSTSHFLNEVFLLPYKWTAFKIEEKYNFKHAYRKISKSRRKILL